MSWALVALLSLGPGAAGAMTGSAAAAGSIAVSSDPAGAEVFLDGQSAGTTPVRLEDVAAGTHSVTVVKDGYLENRRAVVVEAGSTVDVAVPLNQQPGARASLQAGSSSGGGGGGGKKALLIGLGLAAAGAGAYFALRDTNKPPTVGGVSPSPSTGLASATSISFSAQANDPDGDALTYTWDFGDGGTGSGQSPSHTYASAGTFNVSVTVSDGKESVTGNGSVTIRDLNDTWSGSINAPDLGFPYGTTVTLSQSGTSLSGTFVDIFGNTFPVVSGSVSAPLRVRFVVAPPGFAPFSFVGDADASISRLSGMAIGSGFNDPWELSR